jgi:hypothetical protein
MSIRDAIDKLDILHDELTLCVEKKRGGWTPSSRAVLVIALTGDDDEPPLPFVYFLEIDLIREVINVWRDWRKGKKPTLEEKCEAVIYYAENDAYLPC